VQYCKNCLLLNIHCLFPPIFAWGDHGVAEKGQRVFKRQDKKGVRFGTLQTITILGTEGFRTPRIHERGDVLVYVVFVLLREGVSVSIMKILWKGGF
jgi:hypothetical protein